MSATPYKSLSCRTSTWPRWTSEVIDFWSEQQDLSSARWTRRPTDQRWTFYEGPPTANGMPGTHHIEARVFKDVFPRYKHHEAAITCRRMAGWDCHGLPVELAVEKELGFTGKPDIEAYGIAEFNAQCRENGPASRRRLRGDE